MNNLMKSYPSINHELTWKLLDGEAVIVSPTSGEIRVLNHVGSTIWQLLADNMPVDEIILFIIDKYSLSPEIAKADVFNFLTDLEERGLIIWETHS